jgi:hypothetical protein
MRYSSAAAVVRFTAGMALVVAWFLPLYRVPGVDGSVTHGYAWRIALEGWADAALLALAFFWPVLPLVLRRRAESGREFRRGAALLLEPWLAWISAGIIGAASVAFGYAGIFPPWLMIPVSSTIGAGALLGLAADGLYLLVWSGEIVTLIARRLGARSSLRHACC